jgi:hypothetical protein
LRECPEYKYVYKKAQGVGFAIVIPAFQGDFTTLRYLIAYFLYYTCHFVSFFISLVSLH